MSVRKQQIKKVKAWLAQKKLAKQLIDDHQRACDAVKNIIGRSKP